MSNEKIREEFEAWFIRTPGIGGYDIAKYWDGTGYQDRGGTFWNCWQASRAAIEVELPMRKRILEKDWLDWDCFSADKIVSAIEAAGLKVKP